MNFPEKQRKKIALLGGTFDPIHLGHIALAEAAYRTLGVDEVVFLPTQLRYYKKESAGSELYERYAMLAMALEPYDHMVISDLELQTDPEKNYTVNTLRTMKEMFPDTELCFVIGGDSLEHLATWRSPEELMRLATFAAAVRGDVDREKAVRLIEQYQKDFPGSRFELLDMEPCNISSTDIRKKASEGENLEGLVSPEVERFIRKQGLYQKEENVVWNEKKC